MIKVGLLQLGSFIFRRWENFSIVQFVVCWSDSEGPLSLQDTVQPSGSYATENVYPILRLYYCPPNSKMRSWYALILELWTLVEFSNPEESYTPNFVLFLCLLIVAYCYQGREEQLTCLDHKTDILRVVHKCYVRSIQVVNVVSVVYQMLK